jgi:hypothetical protein
MTQKDNFLDSAQAIVTELFDSNEAIKGQFQEHISDDILHFSEARPQLFSDFRTSPIHVSAPCKPR